MIWKKSRYRSPKVVQDRTYKPELVDISVDFQALEQLFQAFDTKNQPVKRISFSGGHHFNGLTLWNFRKTITSTFPYFYSAQSSYLFEHSPFDKDVLGYANKLNGTIGLRADQHLVLALFETADWLLGENKSDTQILNKFKSEVKKSLTDGLIHETAHLHQKAFDLKYMTTVEDKVFVFAMSLAVLMLTTSFAFRMAYPLWYSRWSSILYAIQYLVIGAGYGSVLWQKIRSRSYDYYWESAVEVDAREHAENPQLKTLATPVLKLHYKISDQIIVDAVRAHALAMSVSIPGLCADCAQLINKKVFKTRAMNHLLDSY